MIIARVFLTLRLGSLYNSIKKERKRNMRIVSIVLLVAAVVSFVAGDAAIGAFCLVLGIGLFILSASSGSGGKATPKASPKARPQTPRKVYSNEDVFVPGAPAVDAYAYRGSQESYFYHLLTSVFPDYEVRRGMDLGYGADYAEVSFLMLKDGEPKLAILLGENNEVKSAPFANTRYLLENQGITVQFYINTFRNKASYVYGRVSDALR